MWWLVIIVLALLIPEILSTILDSRLGRAVAARVEGGERDRDASALAERTRHLEGEIEHLTEEVRRLREESDFLQKLLTDRGASARTRMPVPGDDST